MTYRHLHLLVRCVSFFAASVVVITGVKAQTTKNVFVLVIDGARYSETFGSASHEYIPHIWNDLRPLGACFTSFSNNGTTETNPGHASIVTGTWQTIANNGSERPHAPTMFEYYRKNAGTSATDNFVVLGKDKLNVLSYSDHAQYGSVYGASVQYSPSQYDDIKVWENIQTVVSTSHPHLLIANFPKTDNAGHSGVWTDYLKALRAADSLVYLVWEYIQSDSVYKDRTTLIITNDHGRHSDASGGFTNHGDGCEGCRHISLLVVGPNTPQGLTDSSARQQTDIAPTIGALLGFDTPLSTGTRLSSALMTGVVAVQGFAQPDFRLTQNFPNPFNSSTTITFAVPSPSHVSLKIYDILGRVIETLVSTELPAQSYSVRWDAGRLPSGIYFYSLDAKGFSQTKKLVLIR